MQYNIFLVELLGDERLKGVTVPVVINNQQAIEDDKMADISRVFNNYRTVFASSDDSNILNTRIFSVNGEVSDCIYANVAAFYTLAEAQYIRSIESGEKRVVLKSGDTKRSVIINYHDNNAISVTHEIMIHELESIENEETEDFVSELVKAVDNSGGSTRIIWAKDPMTFSKLRKKKIDLGELDIDRIVVYHDEESRMVFFTVERPKLKKYQRMSSRRQIAFMIKYLMDKGIDKSEIRTLTHVLNNGQYAILKVSIGDGVISAKMNARVLVDGILNL